MSTYEVIEGDCLAVMAGMADASFDAIICDPPYGVTSCKWDAVIPFAPMWEQLKRIAKPKAAIVLFGSQPFTSALVMSNPAMFRYEWVWEKPQGANPFLAKIQPMRVHESITVFSRECHSYVPQMETGTPIAGYSASNGAVIGEAFGETRSVHYTNEGTRYPRSVIRAAKERTGEHPTQKPVPLLEYLVRTYTNEGDTVLDFAAGSGTTGVACVNTGRAFIGVESHPPYVEIARRRIAEAASQPRLAGVA